MNTLSLCRLACSDIQIKKTFGGVFASDLLPTDTHGFLSFIVNLDESRLKGSHWISIYFENKYKKVYYFDSYGDAPSNPNILSFLKRNADTIYYNTKCFQDYFTTTCGHFCLYFLYQSVRHLKLSKLSKSNKKSNEKFIKKFVRQKFKDLECCHFSHDKAQKCVS